MEAFYELGIWAQRVQAIINFDIVNFYPSISEKTLQAAIEFAADRVDVTTKDITIIHHARRSLLYTNGDTWIKKNIQSTFNVAMGSYDGAEVCDLVGIHLLFQLKQLSNQNIGLHRDDDLAITNGIPRNTKNLKKNKCVKSLKITGSKSQSREIRIPSSS